MTDAFIDASHGGIEDQRLSEDDATELAEFVNGTRAISYNERMNDLLIENMKKYTNMSDEELWTISNYLTTVVVPLFQGQNTIEQTAPNTLSQTSARYIIAREIEKEIEKQPHDRRTEMYKKVVEGVYGVKRNPDWEKAIVNPNKEPATPFSTSKADDYKSNQQLVDDLASATSMNERTKCMVQAQIVYHDASGDDKRPASIMLGRSEGGKVYGGRLGRDHMLTDVPNHFVRNNIMDYINAEVEEDKKEHARTAVFSDLSPSEIAAYSTFISTSKDEERRKEAKEEGRLEKIMTTHKPQPKSILEAKSVLQQEDLLDSIPDDDLDLTQRGNHGYFDTDFEGVFKPVVKPGSKKLPYEAETNCPLAIDLDCDQVRACTKRFTRNGIWSIDQFRLALGQIARPELPKFLEKRGEAEGKTLRVRALCWQFFKSREVLGLDMTKNSQDDIKKIQDKGKKRASGDDDQTSGKKAKPSTAEWLDAARQSAMGVQKVSSDGGDSTPGRTATPIDLTED